MFHDSICTSKPSLSKLDIPRLPLYLFCIIPATSEVLLLILSYIYLISIYLKLMLCTLQNARERKHEYCMEEAQSRGQRDE